MTEPVDEAPAIIRNLSAQVVLTNGERFALRDTLLGEQVRLANGAFSSHVTPMKHGRFRLWQNKHGNPRVPIDIYAQQVDRLQRHGSTNALGRMAAQPAEVANTFKVVQNGLPFSGEIQSFLGRAVLHGTDEKTGGIRIALVSEMQSLEVKRKLAPPNPRTGFESGEWGPMAAEPDAAVAGQLDATALGGADSDINASDIGEREDTDSTIMTDTNQGDPHGRQAD